MASYNDTEMRLSKLRLIIRDRCRGLVNVSLCRQGLNEEELNACVEVILSLFPKVVIEGNVIYSEDNPFCIDGRPIAQFQEEAKRWEADMEGWITEWKNEKRYFWMMPTWLQEFEKEAGYVPSTV